MKFSVWNTARKCFEVELNQTLFYRQEYIFTLNFFKKNYSARVTWFWNAAVFHYGSSYAVNSLGLDPWLNGICFQLLYPLPGALYASWKQIMWPTRGMLIRNNEYVKSRRVVTRRQRILPCLLQTQPNTQPKRKHECSCGKEILAMKAFIFQNLKTASQNHLVLKYLIKYLSSL